MPTQGIGYGLGLGIGRRRRIRASSPLLQSLIHHYSLEGLTDDGPNGLTLTNNNAATFTAGKVGNAATLVSASSQTLSRADNAFQSLGVSATAVTWTAWAKATTFGVDRVILGKNATGGQRSYMIRYVLVSARFSLHLYTDGSAQAVGLLASTFGAPATGTWYFIRAGYDGTNAKIAVNETENTTAYTAQGFDGTDPFRIGGQTGSVDLWNGQIDQSGMWKRELTAGEKTFLYNSGNGRTYAEIQAYTAFQIHLENLLQRWWQVKGRRIGWAETLLPNLPRKKRSHRGAPDLRWRLA